MKQNLDEYFVVKNPVTEHSPVQMKRSDAYGTADRNS